MSTATYAHRPSRITKDELCMILSFWMQESPLLEKPTIYDETNNAKELNGVGAVLVLPDCHIFALDCSRNDVHGVASLLTKFPHHAKGCTIFSSRKPCSYCTKLLVQSRVSRVFYLPFEPENIDQNDIKRVDHLFKVSQVAQSVFVPNISESVINEGGKKKQNYSPKSQASEDVRESCVEEWKKNYWSKNWTNVKSNDGLKECLPWFAFDTAMKDQVDGDMERMFEWISMVALLDPSPFVRFKEYTAESRPQIDKEKKLDRLPDVESLEWQKLALHITRIAKIVSHKTDDPKTGVGAVIVMENKEIVAVGWNGFPSKALFGEFPRASDSDEAVTEKKYPYVIHAEQNALLTRNKENIRNDSTTLFSTKTPCHECVPLLIQAGVKHVVLPNKLTKPAAAGESLQSDQQLNYDVFTRKLNKGVFKGFISYDPVADPKPDAVQKPGTKSGTTKNLTEFSKGNEG